MAVFPTSIYPVADSWSEEMVHPVEIVRTRNAVGVYEAGSRLRWRGSGELELDATTQQDFHRFMHETNNGLTPFSITTFLKHHYSYTLSSAYSAALSKHKYDAVPLTSGWHVGWENLLESSENLGDATQWTALNGATVTRTGGQTAPDGSSTAWRIQTTGGTDAAKLDNIGYGGTYLPANWRIFMSLWVRNLSATTYVEVWFRGFARLARIAPSTPWTFYSGVVLQSVSFPPGIRFLADNASNNLDFLVWHPMIVAFTPDGSMVPSQAWGDALDYLPTPTGSYLKGDSNGRGYVWRDNSGATSGALFGKMFIENAVMVSSSQVLSIPKKFVAPDWSSVSVMIEEV